MMLPGRFKLAAAVAVLTSTSLVGSAEASLIVFNDTLPDDSVFVGWSGFTSITLSANCLAFGNPSQGAASCADTMPVEVSAASAAILDGADTTGVHLNMWMDLAQTQLANTLTASAAQVSSGVVNWAFTFQPDVEDGTSLVPLVGAPGFPLLDVVVLGWFVTVLGPGSSNPLTIEVLAEDVPEPPSLLMFGSAVLVVAGLRFLQRSKGKRARGDHATVPAPRTPPHPIATWAVDRHRTS